MLINNLCPLSESTQRKQEILINQIQHMTSHKLRHVLKDDFFRIYGYPDEETLKEADAIVNNEVPFEMNTEPITIGKLKQIF